MNTISQPTLILDKNTCLENIKTMVLKAKSHNLVFRPHFKTHQSLEIGRWFKDYGVDKITVSSVSMAEYFANEWSDITIAFPLNILEIDKIDKLSEKINISVLIDSLETLKYLSTGTTNGISFFIKIDTGYHRSGIDIHNFELIDEILTANNQFNNINFSGFLTHAGNTYQCRSKQEVLDIHIDNLRKLSHLKERYIKQYPGLIISIGDTPSCSIANDFPNIDEIRPGNFVFYDLMQTFIGSCKLKQVAAAMACPVVAKYPDRNELIIYGGAVHFSKEYINDLNGRKTFGQVIEKTKNGIGNIVDGMYVTKLSQEHGTIHLPDNISDSYSIGDIVYILPVHSCLTANLSGYYLTDQNQISHL